MTNKIDPMMALFANHNTKNDPHVQSNKSYNGDRKPITTTFVTVEPIEEKNNIINLDKRSNYYEISRKK